MTRLTNPDFTREVLLLHAVTIVTELHSVRALTSQPQLHHGGPSVQAVLQQFLKMKLSVRGEADLVRSVLTLAAVARLRTT